MLRIRLSRHWRRNRPFFRVVLTEHTKPVKSGYKEVLGYRDPINKDLKIDVEKARERISKWAQPSERVAKMLYNLTWDELFKKFFRYIERQRPKKREKEK
jgi:small subunit ribosomal protein S16